MRTILFLILVVISGTVFADIPPMQFPTPLHRIGVEVFAEVVGAIAVGGLVLRQMLAKYGKTKEVDEQEVWNAQRNSADGNAISIGFGGEYVRDAKGGAACWHELRSDERQRLESKLSDELQTFEFAYVEASEKWLLDPELPN